VRGLVWLEHVVRATAITLATPTAGLILMPLGHGASSLVRPSPDGQSAVGSRSSAKRKFVGGLPLFAVRKHTVARAQAP
jgi:hypothetical protein